MSGVEGGELALAIFVNALGAFQKNTCDAVGSRTNEVGSIAGQ
jgi:hypothetical protein